jgi:hypothetical protein
MRKIGLPMRVIQKASSEECEATEEIVGLRE